MTKWEYLNITLANGMFSGGPEMITKKLNEYGEKGWELVNFQSVPLNGLMYFIFKRPLEDE